MYSCDGTALLGMCTDVIEPVRTWHVKFGHVRTVRTVRTSLKLKLKIEIEN